MLWVVSLLSYHGQWEEGPDGQCLMLHLLQLYKIQSIQGNLEVNQSLKLGSEIQYGIYRIDMYIHELLSKCNELK